MRVSDGPHDKQACGMTLPCIWAALSITDECPWDGAVTTKFKSGHSNGSIDLEGSLVALTLAMLEAHNCTNVHP